MMKQKNRKICVVTGTRAEYGIMYWLIKALDEDNDIDLQLIVTGMHLSPEFGLTYQTIEENFRINKKIEILLSSDSPVGISKAMGLAQISFAEAFNELKPDVVIILGDRFEMLAVAASAMIARIPIAHIHGGESTEGLIDEAIRHSITKMSHIHFVATEEYRNRVIQLGEQPKKVFNVGTPALDNIQNLKLLSKKDFEESIEFNLGKKNILVTFHPVTLEESTSGEQFNELLKAVMFFDNLKIIFTKSNADTNGRIVNKMIDEFVAKHPGKACAFTSLGQLRYLSALKYMNAIVGNSSSGLIEAPSFQIPTINIGDRQKGRIKGKSIIDCIPECFSIKEALELAFSENFQNSISNTSNAYGTGGASNRIKDILKYISLKNILKKEFFNIKN